RWRSPPSRRAASRVSTWARVRRVKSTIGRTAGSSSCVPARRAAGQATVALLPQIGRRHLEGPGDELLHDGAKRLVERLDDLAHLVALGLTTRLEKLVRDDAAV